MKDSTNKSLIAIACVVAVLIIASLACGSFRETMPIAADEVVNVIQEPIADAPETGQEIYQVGDIVNLQNSTFIVLGWEKVTRLAFSEPDPGFLFVIIDLVVVNTGDSPSSISSMQSSLRDETSQSYASDFTGALINEGGRIDGVLLPGEKVRGKVRFQVPEDVQRLNFTFIADTLQSEVIFVDLGAEPVMVEAPSEIPGEREQKIYNIGDSVEINNLILTLNKVFSHSGDQLYQPSEGYKFILVDLTIENKSAESVRISSFGQMSIKDSASRRFIVDLRATSAADGYLLNGNYAAGITDSQAGFEVKEDETMFVFSFESSPWADWKVFIEIPLE